MSCKAQPGQIRTCASTHTALMKDGWRKSVLQDKDAGRGVMVSTFRRPERTSPTSSSRFDFGEPERSARAD
jgi:hypothetical protein